MVKNGPTFTSAPSRPWWWRWAAGVITTASNQRGKRTGRLVCSSTCQQFDTAAHTMTTRTSKPRRARRGWWSRPWKGAHDWRSPRVAS